MSTASSGASGSIWASEGEAKLLRRRAFHFWNPDYLEKIALPLLGLAERAQALDVGSGYGGLTLPLARARPDLQITGLDAEAKAVTEAAGDAKRPTCGTARPGLSFFCSGVEATPSILEKFYHLRLNNLERLELSNPYARGIFVAF